jgi:hypothetical protein
MKVCAAVVHGGFVERHFGEDGESRACSESDAVRARGREVYVHCLWRYII